jgi:uncharacterized protein (TIGR02284 family)
MSTDESVTKDLLETLEDGKEGFTKGAEKLGELGAADHVATFQGFAEQRAQFADELQGMAHAYGDDPDRSGSVAGTFHRGWMTLKDALTKDTPKSILDVAEQGEDHAVKEYEKAMSEDISTDLRTVVQRQLDEVRTARDTIKSLAASSN